jgi:hypothetical protein
MGQLESLRKLDIAQSARMNKKKKRKKKRKKRKKKKKLSLECKSSIALVVIQWGFQWNLSIESCI